MDGAPLRRIVFCIIAFLHLVYRPRMILDLGRVIFGSVRISDDLNGLTGV